MWRFDDPEVYPGHAGEPAADLLAITPGVYTAAGVLQEESGATGDGNTSIHLDHASETVQLPGALADTDQISVEVWFKPDGSAQAVQRVIRVRGYGLAIDWRPGTGKVVAWAYRDCRALR